MSNHPNRGKRYDFVVIARGAGVAKFFEREPACNYAQWLAEFGGAITQVVENGAVYRTFKSRPAVPWDQLEGRSKRVTP